MSPWFTSLSLSILVTVIPFTFVLKLLVQLPPPLASSHRRWPMWVNAILIAAVTGCGAVFIRNTYYAGTVAPGRVAGGFLITSLVYAFGLVLLLRQFCGVYPDFIITVGFSGLALRKTSYRNIENVEHGVESKSETRFKIQTSRGGSVSLTLPTRSGALFYEQLRKKLHDE